jgi:hypothetical protein
MSSRRINRGSNNAQHRYEVIAVCDDPVCRNKKMISIVKALNESAAKNTANVLNRTDRRYCPECNKTLGYFYRAFEN